MVAEYTYPDGTTWNLSCTYLMGPNGPMLRKAVNAADARWYLYDGLGSVLGEVSPTGTVTASRKLDVFGAVRSASGTAVSKHAFVGQLGHASDDETYTYMRARYYDPVVGRFASEDPAGDGQNWFAYCNSDPVNFVDRTGKAGEPTTILNSEWGIRIDGPPGGPTADMHIWHNGKEIGSIWNSGTWKHLHQTLSKNQAKGLIEALRGHTSKRVQGWAKVLGRAGFAGVGLTTADAYFEQNPLDFIAIMFDIAGDHETAAQIDHLNQSL